MTKKRFQDIGGYITDTDSYCCTKVYEKTSGIIDLLNELHEEKEIAIDGIKIADKLIKKYGSEELKHEWKKEITVKYR